MLSYMGQQCENTIFAYIFVYNLRTKRRRLYIVFRIKNTKILKKISKNLLVALRAFFLNLKITDMNNKC